LSIALGVEAIKAGRSVYFTTLADLVGVLAKAEREGSLREKIRFLCIFALLIVDEIGYLPVTPGGGNLFFQLVNARYEKGAMILTSNRGFAEWGRSFWRPRRGHGPPGQASSPRDRHPDRRLELPSAPTRRPRARAHSIKGCKPTSTAHAAAQAARPPTQKWSCRSRQRLITTPPTGEFCKPKTGEIPRPVDRPTGAVRVLGIVTMRMGAVHGERLLVKPAIRALLSRVLGQRPWA
jgi:hypothetical protein